MMPRSIQHRPVDLRTPSPRQRIRRALRGIQGRARGSALWLLILLGTGIGAHAAPDCRPGTEPIGTLRDMYDGALPPDLAVSTFRNIGRLFPTRSVPASDHPTALEPADKPLRQIRFKSRGKAWDLVDYLAVNRVAGLLVLKDSRIAYERYLFGNSPTTCWMSMSMAKSVTSTLIGVALADGAIHSLEDPVTRYVPRLKGSAYEGVSVRDVLMMSSGVKWNETYTDPNSDRRHLLEAQIAQHPGALLDVMRALPRAAPAGTVNNYSTGETQIAGEVLHGAIKRPIAEYLSDRIWKPAGMETSASWWLTAPEDIEVAGSGFSATLRDYGRLGLFVMNGGVAGGKQVLPAGWVQEAGSPKILKGGKPLRYGYFWWTAWPTDDNPTPPPTFMAIGIFGQYLYIDPAERLVIVVLSAQSKPTDMDIVDDMDFFAAVTKALH